MTSVPVVPGVPPVLGNIGAPEPSLMMGDTAGAAASVGPPQWGIFKDGQAVITPDTVVSFDYRQDWLISDYPLEEGAFESYDKVNTPFDARVRMATGGSLEARQEFLNALEAISSTLDLYDVATPEKIYTSVNVGHVDYSRASTNGVGILNADIWLRQIRVTATVQFTNTKSPGAASSQNGGTVQTQPATAAQAADTGSFN